MTKSLKIKAFVIAVIAVAVILIINSFYQGFREPRVRIDGNRLIIQTPNGITLDIQDIREVRLLQEIPTLTRVGGFGVLSTQRGQVRTSQFGNGLAFVRLNPPPYIFLELRTVYNYVILNLHDAENTQTLYEDIRLWLNG